MLSCSFNTGGDLLSVGLEDGRVGIIQIAQNAIGDPATPTSDGNMPVEVQFKERNNFYEKSWIWTPPEEANGDSIWGVAESAESACSCNSS